jgi:hypothetical protein
MHALIATALLGLAGATLVLAQDRIKEMPGHDQFTKMQPQINGSMDSSMPPCLNLATGRLPTCDTSPSSARCAFASAIFSSMVGCWRDYRNADTTFKLTPPLAETSMGCMVGKMRIYS